MVSIGETGLRDLRPSLADIAWRQRRYTEESTKLNALTLIKPSPAPSPQYPAPAPAPLLCKGQDSQALYFSRGHSLDIQEGLF